MQNVNVHSRSTIFTFIHSKYFLKIIQNYSKSKLARDQNWMNIQRKRSLTLNIHTTFLKYTYFTFFIYFTCLIFIQFWSFWIIMNDKELISPYTWWKLNENEAWMFGKVQFFNMRKAKVVKQTKIRTWILLL